MASQTTIFVNDGSVRHEITLSLDFGKLTEILRQNIVSDVTQTSSNHIADDCTQSSKNDVPFCPTVVEGSACFDPNDPNECDEEGFLISNPALPHPLFVCADGHFHQHRYQDIHNDYEGFPPPCPAAQKNSEVEKCDRPQSAPCRKSNRRKRCAKKTKVSRAHPPEKPAGEVQKGLCPRISFKGTARAHVCCKSIYKRGSCYYHWRETYVLLR